MCIVVGGCGGDTRYGRKISVTDGNAPRQIAAGDGEGFAVCLRARKHRRHAERKQSDADERRRRNSECDEYLQCRKPANHNERSSILTAMESKAFQSSLIKIGP